MTNLTIDRGTWLNFQVTFIWKWSYLTPQPFAPIKMAKTQYTLYFPQHPIFQQEWTLTRHRSAQYMYEATICQWRCHAVPHLWCRCKNLGQVLEHITSNPPTLAKPELHASTCVGLIWNCYIWTCSYIDWKCKRPHSMPSATWTKIRKLLVHGSFKALMLRYGKCLCLDHKYDSHKIWWIPSSKSTQVG